MGRALLAAAALLSWFGFASPVGADTVSPAQASVYPATLCTASEGRWHLQWIVRSRDSDPVSISANVDGASVSFSPNPVGPGATATSSNKAYGADPPDVTLHYTLSTSRPNSAISGTSVATFMPCELPPTTTTTFPPIPGTHVPSTPPLPPPPPLPTFPPTTLARTTLAPTTSAPTTTSTTVERTTTTRRPSTTTTSDPTTTQPAAPVGEAAAGDDGSDAGPPVAPVAGALALAASAGVAGTILWRRRAAGGAPSAM